MRRPNKLTSGREPPKRIIFIAEESNIILDRRAKDSKRSDREKETISDIDSNRDLQIKICNKYGGALGIPVSILKL